MNQKYELHPHHYPEMDIIWNYAKLMQRPLELWMVVPCDEEGNVLEEPENWDNYLEFSGPEVKGLKKEIVEYQQAKERCWFEGDLAVKLIAVLSVSDVLKVEDWIVPFEEMDVTPTKAFWKEVGL